jgi:16S rRNA (uracil1498-N3)-methyltransferase
MEIRRFYSSDMDLAGGRAVLDGDESHHLRDVLRLTVGTEIRLFDGEGREFAGRIEQIGKSSSMLTVTSEVEPTAPESPCDITLAAALLKHDKFETVIQKAVELGVNRLVPLISARCDVKIVDPGKRMARWHRIALDATKQCGRARLMTIDAPLPLAEFLAVGPKDSLKLMFSERDGEPLGQTLIYKRVFLVVGPEGGWDDAEIRVASDNGFSVVTFGGRIMRAETAAIAVTAIIQHRIGDIN